MMEIIIMMMVLIVYRFCTIGFFRQTNCRNLDAAIPVQKRREVIIQTQRLREKQKNAAKVPRLGCQHPYHGYIAREMAQNRREAEAEATRAATEAYRDPRADMTSQELREEFNRRTNTSRMWFFSD